MYVHIYQVILYILLSFFRLEQKAATFNLPSRRSSWPGKDDEIYCVDRPKVVIYWRTRFSGRRGMKLWRVRFNLLCSVYIRILRTAKQTTTCVGVRWVPAADRLMTYWKVKNETHWNTHRPIISSLFWGTAIVLAHVCCIESYCLKGLACYGKSTRDMWLSRRSARRQWAGN